MMDATTSELLSRYVDGDLTREEEQRLEQRLDHEPELLAELAALESLRSEIRAFAASEQPPEELDRLLEPLRQSPPPSVVVRPFFRWLATAACVVIGVAVLIEVGRSNPGPPLLLSGDGPGARSMRPAPRSDSDYFQLRPLPGPEEGTETVGVLEELLELPEPEPELGEHPAPLEVIGPLPAPPDDPDYSAESAVPEPASDRREEHGFPGVSAGAQPYAAPADGSGDQLYSRRQESIGRALDSAEPQAARAALPELGRAALAETQPESKESRACQLLIAGQVIRADLSCVKLGGEGCSEERYDRARDLAVGVLIAKGEISRIWPVDPLGREEAADRDLICVRPDQGWLGLEVVGVADGQHIATISLGSASSER